MLVWFDIWIVVFIEIGNCLFYKKSGQVNNILFIFVLKIQKIVEIGGYFCFYRFMDLNIYQLD